MKREIIHTYKNGNYTVDLYSDGTKIRMTGQNTFKPEFAENCDVRITNKCDGNCLYCYDDATENGHHAKLFDSDGRPLQKWLTTLFAGTELALNGNDLSHPSLDPENPVLLRFLQDRNIITNLTINQKHFMKNLKLLKSWTNQKLIWGLGVSLVSANEEFFKALADFPNAVVHTIAGVLTEKDLEELKKHQVKVLVLGYKDKGRGKFFRTQHQDPYTKNLEDLKNFISKKEWGEIKVLSFDNLALEQLDVQNLLFKDDPKSWELFYSGDDGAFTFYIDAVQETFSVSSTIQEHFSSKGMSVLSMFKKIQEVYGKA